MYMETKLKKIKNMPQLGEKQMTTNDDYNKQPTTLANIHYHQQISN